MKKFILPFLLFVGLQKTQAQLDLPPSGGNPRAMISEEVGITSITIKYSRPDVNKREGKIYGEGKPVHFGFTGQNFKSGKSDAPWRAGANEVTTIQFEHNVKVEGKDIKAGIYGLFMAVGEDSTTLIFSKQTEAWGSFYYDEKDDVARINVKSIALEKSVEYLKYEFVEHKENSCKIAMQWEYKSIPFTVQVEVDKIVVERFRDELNTRKGFTPALLLQATQFCFTKNINLEEALSWSKRAIDGIGGQKTFITLRNLATAYEKLNRIPEADSTMNEALLIATANQYVAYGRQLITQKRPDRALDIFKANQKRYGDIFAVQSGLMYGYSAKGDFKNAIKMAEKAINLAPNDAAKKSIADMVIKLKEGKDIN